uniref:Zgc:113276 n=1 Tax=Dicentrarchus labrax TaxID=13489 RepID=A0A8C4HYW5_DICLA
MVILDVLIIGGGPHALTLASLLSNPDPNSDPGHDLPLSPSCLDSHRPQPETSSNKRCSGKKKKKRATAVSAGVTLEEQLAKSIISERAVCPRLSLRVVDSYGEWTTLWESQFTALNIRHLRSHTLVHTDPLNKKALQEFVLKYDRSAELHSLPDQVYILDENAFFNDMRLGKKERKRLNITSTLRKSLAFSLPGTKLSVDFFKDQVERYNLDKVLVKGTVEYIRPVIEHKEEMQEENHRIKERETEDEAIRVTEKKKDGSRKTVKYFQVQLQEGTILKARHVVMATGPTRAQMANIPSWVKSIGESYPEERLQHTVHLMHHLPNARQKLKDTDCQRQKDTFSTQELCVVCEAGQRVMVVGGGLTSAHVVSIALQQGASHVTWVMRKHLQLKQFDVGDVESLVGRYSHVEHGIKMDGQAYLRQFYNERSLHKRLAMIRQARKGGAITPEAYIQLQPFILNGQVDLKTYCQVSETSWCYRSQAWSLSLSTGDHWTGDMIWLATGCKLDVKQDPLLSEVMKEFPIQVIDGWPCISESLQWSEECPLYLMGQYTALQVGPHAVNLAGGQAASMRIAKDIMRHQKQDNAEASELSGEKSKTEEYIKQMQGLLWL